MLSGRGCEASADPDRAGRYLPRAVTDGGYVWALMALDYVSVRMDGRTKGEPTGSPLVKVKCGK